MPEDWIDVAAYDTFPKALRYHAETHPTDVAMREKDFGLWNEYTWSDYQDRVKLLSLGLPIAFTMVAEISLFSVVALLIAPLGTHVIAGHQIALSVSAITFMLPLSNGIAITIQVGNYLGAGRPEQARFASAVGIAIGLLLASVNMAIIFFGRETIAGFYTIDPVVLMRFEKVLITVPALKMIEERLS